MGRDLDGDWLEDEDLQLFFKELRLSGYHVELPDDPADAGAAIYWDNRSSCAYIAGYSYDRWGVWGEMFVPDREFFDTLEEAIDALMGVLNGGAE